MSTLKVIDCDIVYLSYDEPNAEKNYADLLKKVPWAKRVHGVEGSDAAHKTCARLSDTEYFITVDADNIVDPKFFDLEIASSPMQSLANKTFVFNSSSSLLKICLSEYLSVGPSFGLPRCDIKITLPPSFSIFFIVGIAALILVSSETLKLSSKGTLKSTLTKTFFPLKETVEIVFMIIKFFVFILVLQKR
jgi:hypothetical protein